MFYKNLLKIPKTIKYKTVNLKFNSNFDCDNDIEDTNRTKPIFCTNFNTSNNVLKNSYGEMNFVCCNSQDGNVEIFPKIGELSSLRKVKYFVKTDESNTSKQKIIVEDNKGKVYFSNLNDGSSTLYDLIELDEYCKSKFFNYYYDLENLLLISTNLNNVCKFYIYNGNKIYNFENIPEIFDICSHNNTMFLSFNDGYRNRIYYTEDANPMNLVGNLNSLNSIGLPINKGKILKIISFNDYLYVFCEYGIVRLMSYRNQEEYEIEEVYSGTSRIIENTILIGGENLIFADMYGIYIFNGANVKKIELGFNSLFKDIYKWRSCACFSNGKYYLATNLNYTDETIETYDDSKNNCLVVYDIFTGDVEVCFDISICDMTVYYDEAESKIAILSGAINSYKLKTLCNNGLFNGNQISKKLYVSEFCDVDKPNVEKIIRSISVVTHEEITINLIANNEEVIFKLEGSEEEQLMVVNKKCEKFAVEIESKTSNPYIKNLKVLVGVYE